MKSSLSRCADGARKRAIEKEYPFHIDL